jgi:hypothetical protein
MQQVGSPERDGSIAVTTFYRLIPDAPLPQKADRRAGGHLPIRAVRYCEAITAATSYGWWMYAPMEIWLLFTGGVVYWTWKDQIKWLPLGAAQFPNFTTTFDEAAPEELRGFSPPFLTALPENGVVQVWTGYFVRTSPDWSLLVRSPVNFPASIDYNIYEGIIESDRWFGPVFANLKLNVPDNPVKISRSTPLVQIQPLPRAAYADRTNRSFVILDQIRDFSDDDWQGFRTTVVRPQAKLRAGSIGSYAVQARKRKKQEERARS